MYNPYVCIDILYKMKEEHTKPVTQTFSARMSALQLAMLYRFMIKRISRGYSTAEASFLMGYHIDFIKQKEELKSIGFSFEEMHCFRHAMEEISLSALTPGFEPQNETKGYLLKKHIEGSGIKHTMFRIEEDRSEVLVFQLLEENPGYIRYETAEKENAAEVRAILNVLFEGRLFFSPQAPLVIYQRCRTAIGNENIEPRYVQAALLELTKKHDFPKLKRIRSSEYGCRYEKVFE